MRSVVAVAVACEVIGLGAAPARAEPEPVYPAALVDRTPWLPEGMSEVRAAATSPQYQDQTEPLVRIDVDVEARHSLGVVEPFLGVQWVARGTSGSYRDLHAGVRAPVTATGDVLVSARTAHSFIPYMNGDLEYATGELDAAYETRIPLEAHLSAIAARAGFGAGRDAYRDPPVGDLTPTMTYVSWFERAFASAELEVQPARSVALAGGIEAHVDRYTARADTDAGADLYAMMLIDVEPVDLTATITNVDIIGNVTGSWRFAASVAMRF
jgi:hypothetical protein